MVSGAKDPWETDDPEYSIDEFYTRSKDKQGHSTLFHVRVPDDLAGALAAIVQSKEIPAFKTAQDIFRDAIVHRLHYLGQNMESLKSRPQIRELLSRITLENSIAQYAEELDFYENMIKKIESTCIAALNNDDYSGLEKYILEQEEMIKTYREPFVSRMLGILEKYKERIDIRKPQ